jgi:hypothetical protein
LVPAIDQANRESLASKMRSLIRGYSIFITGLLYIVTALLGVGNWHGILSVATLLIIVQCITVTTGLTRFVGYGLFFLGSALLTYSDANLSTWFNAIIQNGNVLTLIVFVPLMGLPLSFPKYRSALESTLQKRITGSRNGIYLLGHGISHLLGSVVNIACISMTYSVFIIGTRGKYRNMLARAAMRGYGSTLFWSPNSAAVGVVLAYWGHELVDIIPYGLPLALLTLVVGWLEDRARYRVTDKKSDDNSLDANNSDEYLKESLQQLGSEAANNPNVNNDKNRYVRQLVAGITSMLAIVILLDMLTSISILTLVPLVALIITLIWAALTGDIARYISEFKKYLTEVIPKMSNEATIFLGAGFFAVAVGVSPIGHYLPLLFKSVAGNATLVLMLTGVLIIGLSMFGLHPMLTTTSILTALTPQTLGLSFPFMAMAILGSFGLAVTCSPFSAGNLNVASIVGKDSTEISIKWQLAYSLMMFLVLVIYLSVIKLFFEI